MDCLPRVSLRSNSGYAIVGCVAAIGRQHAAESRHRSVHQCWSSRKAATRCQVDAECCSPGKQQRAQRAAKRSVSERREQARRLLAPIGRNAIRPNRPWPSDMPRYLFGCQRCRLLTVADVSIIVYPGQIGCPRCLGLDDALAAAFSTSPGASARASGRIEDPGSVLDLATSQLRSLEEPSVVSTPTGARWW